MKRILILILAILPLTASAAVGKLHPALQMALKHTPATRADAAMHCFVRLAHGASADILSPFCEVLTVQGRIAIVSVERDMLAALQALDGVESIGASRPLDAQMNVALPMSGALPVIEGTDLDRPYTGRGVIAGILDSGFDPNHINFLGPDGTSRVKYLMHTTGNETIETIDEYGDGFASPVSEFTTDDPTNTHGTHTMGTMAGSFRGICTLAEMNADGTASVQQKPNTYFGVAPEAEIAAWCGPLYETQMALGLESICRYAQQQGKRIVVNLSISSQNGARDGSEYFTQFMDECASRYNAIICLASGNYGNCRLGIRRDAQPEPFTVRTFLSPSPLATAANIGVNSNCLEAYSDDDTPFRPALDVIDTTTGQAVLTIAPASADKSEYFYADTLDELGDVNTLTPDLAQYFTGYVGFLPAMSASSRFNYWIDVELNNTAANAAASDGFSRYMLAWRYDVPAGAAISIYSDNSRQQFADYADHGMTGYTEGSEEGSLSDLITGHNTIAVGAYVSATTMAQIDGGVRTTGSIWVPGTMGYFTSFGTTLDGRSLPHVCAPGAFVTSSYSRYYMQHRASQMSAAEAATFLGSMQAKAQQDGNDYYWSFIMGTSMSSPYVAGGIALWLEADPQLTLSEVRSLIERTSTVDADVLGTGLPGQWGAGKFNAYAGMKQLLTNTVVAHPDSPSSRLLCSRIAPGVYELTLGGVSALHLRVYSMQGACVMAHDTPGCTATLDLTSLPKGIYIVAAGAQTVKLLR